MRSQSLHCLHMVLTFCCPILNPKCFIFIVIMLLPEILIFISLKTNPLSNIFDPKFVSFFWADCMTKSHINGRKMVTIKSHLFKKLCLCMISSTPSSSIIRYVCIIILSLTDSVVFLIQWAPLSSPDVSNHDNHHHEKTMISESTT